MAGNKETTHRKVSVGTDKFSVTKTVRGSYFIDSPISTLPVGNLESLDELIDVLVAFRQEIIRENK